MTIGDFIELQRGYDLTEGERLPGDVPVFGAAGLNGFHSIAKAKGIGVIVGRSGGSFGQVHLCEKDFWPHNTAMFVSDFKGNDRLFTFYLLKSIDFSRYNSGSAQPSLNRNYIYPIPIHVPQPHEQKQISDVLWKIDSKISLNNRINAELEAMAKTIYYYWFVQFDFPNKNGKPYKASGGKMVWSEELKREVPEGWEVISLGNRIDVQRGISYASSDLNERGIPMISLNSFNLNGTYKPDGLKYFSGKYSSKGTTNSGDLLIAATDVTRNADIIGKAILVPNYYRDELVYSMDVAKIIPKSGMTSSYLLMLFNSEHYHNYIKHFASGTLVLHLNIDGVRWYKTEIPDSSLLKKFHDLYTPIATRVSATQMENQKLTELRDWLLPMLMNGQIKIKDAEREMVMAAEPVLSYKKTK